MRKLFTLFSVLLLLGCACSENESKTTQQQYLSIDTVPMLIMQIQKTSRLYTAEYKIHKIVTHNDKVSIKGSLFKQDFNVNLPMGDRKIAIPMDATLKAYIDFSDFNKENINKQGDKIIIYLPDPKVVITSSKINQKEIKQYVSLMRSNFSDQEMTSYEQQGRESIIKSIPQLGILQTAQANATKVLVPMLHQLGYQEKDITITYKKEYTSQDIQLLIEKTSSAQ